MNILQCINDNQSLCQKAIDTNCPGQISYNYLDKMNKSKAYSNNRLVYRIIYIIIDTYGNTAILIMSISTV